MSEFQNISAQDWDRLIDFAYPCDEQLTPQEVQEKLRQLKVDSSQAFNKVKLMVDAVKARASLAAARQKRPSVMARIAEVSRNLADGSRRSIEEARLLLQQQLGGQAGAAYAHKLEQANEADLRSMLDDLARLEALEKADNDVPPEH